MTRVYLESTRASRSSILGSIMGGAVSSVLGVGSDGTPPQAGDELDHLAGGRLQVVVDHGGVELRLGGQLVAGLGQAPADLLVGLGAAAAQAALQLLEARRG